MTKNEITKEARAMGAQAIRDLREAKGLTQQALASKLGLEQAAVSRLETGVNSPSVTTLLRVAKASGTKLVIRFE